MSAPQSMKSIGSYLEMTEREVESHCETHGAYCGTERSLGHRVIRPRCPMCNEERKAAEKKQAEQRDRAHKINMVKRLFGNSGIPPRFEGRSFDNYRATDENQSRSLNIAKTYAEQFEDRLRHGGGLAFCGKPGTGKTHLACAIANAIIFTGRSAVFTTVIRAVRSVKDTYRRESTMTEQDAIDKLVVPDLLILDEVGVQFGSETEKMILSEILNTRYERFRPTILISNLTPDELGDYVGTRALDRTKEGGGAVLAFTWDSYRGQVAKDSNLPANNVKPVDWGTE